MLAQPLEMLAKDLEKSAQIAGCQRRSRDAGPTSGDAGETSGEVGADSGMLAQIQRRWPNFWRCWRNIWRSFASSGDAGTDSLAQNQILEILEQTLEIMAGVQSRRR